MPTKKQQQNLRKLVLKLNAIRTSLPQLQEILNFLNANPYNPKLAQDPFWSKRGYESESDYQKSIDELEFTIGLYNIEEQQLLGQLQNFGFGFGTSLWA